MGERIEAPNILAAKAHGAPSVFRPENLLREARRQRGVPDAAVPAVCALARSICGKVSEGGPF